MRTLAACAALLLAGSLLLFAGCRKSAADDAGELVLSGNIEVIDAQLAFKLPGRLVERSVEEGQTVIQGQRVARLEDAEQVHELALRRAELAAAEAVLAELRAGSRPQEIAAAAAAVRSAEAERERAQLEFTRQQELLAKNVIAHREFEAAQAQLRVAEARLAEGSERLKLIQEGPRQEAIRHAEARLQQALAAAALAQTRLDYTQLFSPLGGVVLAHHAEPGEYVSPGSPVLSVADLGQVWVRVYLSQPDLGRIHHGQKVQVRTATHPEKHYEGTIGFIASEAEFTPKTVQTPKERVRLVFRLKVDVANPEGTLKPGMPADVIVPGKSPPIANQ